jgi:hypothetical protein
MAAELKLHESHLDKISPGMPVTITVDAVPGRSFEGRIARIAPLPDGQSAWMNPDLKVYNTVVHLSNESAEMRSGMSCRAEILVDQYEDALYIPVQAVLLINDVPTVYLPGATKPVPHSIEIGLDNNNVVRVLSGLEVGQKVLLAPPLATSSLSASAKASPLRAPPSSAAPGESNHGASAVEGSDAGEGTLQSPAEDGESPRRTRGGRRGSDGAVREGGGNWQGVGGGESGGRPFRGRREGGAGGADAERGAAQGEGARRRGGAGGIDGAAAETPPEGERRRPDAPQRRE